MITNQSVVTQLKNDKVLLRHYAQHRISTKDLMEETGCKNRQNLHRIIHIHFPKTEQDRQKMADVYMDEVETFINQGLPFDVFCEDNPLFDHTQSVASMRKKIDRWHQQSRIILMNRPVTLKQFKKVLNHVRVKQALVENAQVKPSKSLSVIARDLQVSYSFVTKISRTLEGFLTYYLTEDYETLMDSVERLYHAYQLIYSDDPNAYSPEYLYGFDNKTMHMIRYTINQCI